MKGIYLDNSLTARPSPRAVSTMLPFYSDMWGTPSAPHQGGYELLSSLEASYKAIYRLLGAGPDDTFVFTSSGAEAVNQAFHSIYWGMSRVGGRNEYLVAAIDEAPALMCVSRLEELGCRGVLLAPDTDGVISVAALAEALTSRTALVSLSWGQGLTGMLQPAIEICRLCSERGVAVHFDVTHALGKLPCALLEAGAHYITFNGEQLHAPSGTGGLMIRSGALRAPLIVGGIEQAYLRSGNFNVPALVALGAACREALEECDYIGTEVARLRSQLEDGLTKSCPGAQALFTHHTERLPHLAVIAFPGIVNEALLFALHRRQLYACIGGGSFQQLALVLEACQVPLPLAHSSLSFSLSRDTTSEDITKAIQIVTAAVEQLRPLALEEPR